MKKFLLFSSSMFIAACVFAQDASEEPAGPVWSVVVNRTEPADCAGVQTFEMTNTGAQNSGFDIYSGIIKLEDCNSTKPAKYFLTLRYVDGDVTTDVKYNNGGSTLIQPGSGDIDVTVSAFLNTKGVQAIWSLYAYGITDSNRRALGYFPSSSTGEQTTLFFNNPLNNGEFKAIQNVTKNFTTGYDYFTGSAADQMSFTPKQKWPLGVYKAYLDYGTMNFAIEKADAVDVEINGYATFVAPASVKVPAGVTPFTLKYNGSTQRLEAERISLTEGNLPANTPVLLVADNGVYSFELTPDATYSLASETTPTYIYDVTMDDNVLVGVMQPHFLKEGCYFFSGEVFDLWDEKDSGDGKGKTVNYHMVTPFTAYVSLPEPGENEVAPETLAVVLPDPEPTGVENIAVDNGADSAIYDVWGVRVDSSYKGIVIRDGKKYIQR